MNTSGSSALRRVASEPIPDGVVRVRFHKTIPTFVALRRESEGKARAESRPQPDRPTTLAARRAGHSLNTRAPRAGLAALAPAKLLSALDRLVSLSPLVCELGLLRFHFGLTFGGYCLLLGCLLLSGFQLLELVCSILLVDGLSGFDLRHLALQIVR